MKHLHPLLPITLSTLWIGANEFIRNELILKSTWVAHYASLKLDFPDAPINGGIWLVWSLSFASLLYFLSRKYSFRETLIAGWLTGFVLMWLVIGNLGVLPFGILPFAIPWSIIEVAGVVWIMKKCEK